MFSEAGHAWGTLPRWARFLIDFGYEWPMDEVRPRRIALISMPCDSAGAGLIALGGMIRSLTNPKANDVAGHYDALRRFAIQYLTSCRDCDLRCDPQSKGCGHTSEASGRIRYKGKKRYEVIKHANFDKGEIWFHGEGVDRPLIPKYATDWQIEGEPLPQLIDNTGALPERVYADMVGSALIVPENLRRSFSGLCLAGRATGEAATRDSYASLRLRVGDTEYGLPELLTVYQWHQYGSISRISFFNARTQQINRSGYAPALVVADGDVSFLRALDRSEFQRSDVIGIIHRSIERDNLEAVGNRILNLQQWYIEDGELMTQLSAIPKGISVALLRRRTP